MFCFRDVRVLGRARSEPELFVSICCVQQQFECSVEHKFGVGCVGGGAVSCRVALDRGAYVPGQSIVLTAQLRNDSRTTVRATRAALTEVRYLPTYAQCAK